MAEKFAIYAGPPLATALAGYESSRSARVNQIIGEWQQMVSELCPKLTVGEWMATIDALLSTWIDDDTTLKYAWADVQEAEGIGEKWGINQPALAAQIKALSHAELLAMREVMRRFRLLDGGHTHIDGLRLAGARISESGDAATA